MRTHGQPIPKTPPNSAASDTASAADAPDASASPPMRRALNLAWRALGTTSPNPAVGCVITKNGKTIAQGYTHPPGSDHAEAHALKQAGPNARGATLYATLEPCNHRGRTPPCADAIIAAGIAEAHIAVQDPNPNVAGGGIAKLQAAGIRVHTGEAAQEAAQLIEAFAKHSATGIPFITAKFAMSLDGKIAARSGDSKWISNPQSRELVHIIRAQSDAILIGINTALTDDPALTARPATPIWNAAEIPPTAPTADADIYAAPAENLPPTPLPPIQHPLRVIADSNRRLPPTARMLAQPGKTLIAAAIPGNPPPNAQTLTIPTPDGRVDLPALLTQLGARGITSILVEGGGGILGALFDQNLVDKVVAFAAPVIIGGESAPAPVRGAGAPNIANAVRLRNIQIRRLGDDAAIIGYCGSNEYVHRHR